MEKELLFKNKSLALQILFILIILYAVSVISVLCIALGVLPYLHYKFYLKDNIPYAIISFVLAVLLSAYHLSDMLRNRKRKTDKDGNGEPVHWFKGKSLDTRLLFILIVLYTPCAIAALVLILRLISFVSIARIPYISIAFAIVSFLLAALISACHLRSMIRRRKRKTDRIAGSPAA
jgi:membrane protein implicated in regulation of membrane protease activity